MANDNSSTPARSTHLKIISSAVAVAFVAAAGGLYFKFKQRADVASGFSTKIEEGVLAPSKAGMHAPLFEGITLNGQSFKLNPAHSEKTVVVFWASWCPPCAEETPALIAMSKRHLDWQVVAVSNDSTEHELRDFLRIFPNFVQPNIAIVWDLEKKVSSGYGITGLPESFLIDKKGELIQKFVGAVDWKQF